MKAGSKVIEKYRLEKRLHKIKQFLEGCKNRNDVARKVEEDYSKSLDMAKNDTKNVMLVFIFSWNVNLISPSIIWPLPASPSSSSKPPNPSRRSSILLEKPTSMITNPSNNFKDIEPNSIILITLDFPPISSMLVRIFPPTENQVKISIPSEQHPFPPTSPNPCHRSMNFLWKYPLIISFTMTQLLEDTRTFNLWMRKTPITSSILSLRKYRMSLRAGQREICRCWRLSLTKTWDVNFPHFLNSAHPTKNSPSSSS